MRLPSFKAYLWTVATFLAFEGLSYLGYIEPIISPIVVIALSLVTFWVCWKNLEYGILILVCELCVGGKGYLFSVTAGSIHLSIRIALFVVVLMAWIIRHRGHGNPLLRIPQTLRFWLTALGLMLAWGVVAGLLHHRELGAVYFDTNAFLFFLLTPVLFSPAIDRVRLGRIVLTILAAAATLLGIKSIISLGLFAHVDVGQLKTYYRWIRITGVGEIAYINGNEYRVFFQSQIYGLFGALLLLPFLLPDRTLIKRTWWLLAPITLGTTAVLISLSRSFWAGAAVALLAGGMLGWLRARWSIRQCLAIGAVAICVVGVSYTLTSWALNFPYPFPPAGGSKNSGLISQRFQTIGGEAAASSRINELAPLRTGILHNPIFGSGFGTPLTYHSNDPRQLQSPSKGVFTTYSFEWGYLDLILKIGLLGFVAYAGLIWVVIKGLWKQRTPITFGLIMALSALLVIHVTTPYLNHPLGIGLLLLALLYANHTIEESG